MLNPTNGELIIDTSDFALEDTTLTVKLFFESIASQEEPGQFGIYTFDLTFDDLCNQDFIDTTSLDIIDMTYYISRGTVVLSPQYTQNDNECATQYGIELVIDGVDEPLTVDQEAYLMLDPANGELTIDTSDFALEDTTLTVKLFLESINSTEDPGQFGIYTFDLTFDDLCNQDTITPTSVDITDMIYYIGRGTITLSPLYEQSDILCAVQYGILLVDDGIDTALTPAQEAFLMLNQANGELTIDNSDFTMDDVVLTVKLYMESTASTVTDVPGQIGTYIFEITFDD